MTKTLSPCVFAWDGITDPTLREPVRYCDNCKLREDHPRHTLPSTPADVTATEQRRFPDGDH